MAKWGRTVVIVALLLLFSPGALAMDAGEVVDAQSEALEVDGLQQAADSYMQAFRGTMEFYNWETGSYDKIEPREEYDSAYLEPYLDGENRLTVRYEDETAEEGDGGASAMSPDPEFTDDPLPLRDLEAMRG